MKTYPLMNLNTFSGILSVLIWATAIPLGRSLTERVGMFTAASSIYLLSGAISISFYLFSRRATLRYFTKLSPVYLLLCGGPFVIYILFLYLAIGLASNRQQIIQVGLLNYMWPVLTLVFSLMIFKNRARPFYFILGAVFSIAGIVLANVTITQENFSIQSFCSNLYNNFLPYMFASGAAILWGLYSNLSKYYSNYSNVLGVPVFLLFSGLVLEILGLFFPENPDWNTAAYIELALIVIFPSITAYILWDIAVRKGNLVFVASFAYLTPLLSTIVTGLYLGVPLLAGIWIACFLVITGAIICKLSIREAAEKVDTTRGSSITKIKENL